MANYADAVKHVRELVETSYPEGPPRELAQHIDNRITALLDAITALGDEFSKFRTDTSITLDELRDEIAEGA